MVVYERALGGVDVVVRDEGNKRHLKGRWGSWRKEGKRVSAAQRDRRWKTSWDQALINVKVGRLVEFMHFKLLSESSNNLPRKIISTSSSLPFPRSTPAVGWNARSANGGSGGGIGRKRNRSDRPFDLAFFGAPLPLFFLSSMSCNLCCSAVSTSPISGNWRIMEESERVGG